MMTFFGIYERMNFCLIDFILHDYELANKFGTSFAAWIFIFVGGIAFVIASIGICGACRESQCLIFMVGAGYFAIYSKILFNISRVCLLTRRELQLCTQKY